MNSATQLTKFETLETLKALVNTQGPCLSVYMPLAKGNAKQNELRWRDTLDIASERARQFGPEAAELLASVRDWNGVDPEQQNGSKSIAVFASKAGTHVVLLETEETERAIVANHFFIRPLLTTATRCNEFYLLALSQKDTRLLRCTRETSELLPLPASTKTAFEEWMNEAKPDHTLVYNATVSGGIGGMSTSMRALAPKGSDKERKSEYLAHFFQNIDKGVAEVLAGKTEPLVVCAVEYEIPMYTEVNTYPHLCPETVHGAPNSLKSGEMHARAIEALDRHYVSKVDDALAEWNHKVGGGASSRIKDVVTAAHDGRITTLVVSDSLEKTGAFDEETHQVHARETGTGNDEELVNDAAVQTLLHAGKVLVAAHRKMPNGAAAAAIFRY